MAQEQFLAVGAVDFMNLVRKLGKALEVIRTIPDLSLRSKMATLLYYPLCELRDASFKQFDMLEPEFSVVQSFDEMAAELRDLM